MAATCRAVVGREEVLYKLRKAILELIAEEEKLSEELDVPPLRVWLTRGALFTLELPASNR
jgi:hypothetical protein